MTVKQLLTDFGNSALRLATFGRFGTKSLTIFRDNFYPVGSVSQSLTGALSSEGLNSNVVMAPVMWIMRTFTEATAVVESWKAENQTWNYVNDHAVERLVERPNEFYNGDALWKATCVSYVLAGNAYWRKIRNPFGDVIALWYVPHWLIQPKWDSAGTTFITHYEYTTGVGPPERVPVRDVVHFRFGLDLENPRLGMSPLRPLLREVGVDDEASKFSETILGNMGVPGLVMSPKFEKYAPKGPEIEKLREYLSNAFSGRNRGKPMVMGVPTEVHQFGFNPNQVELTNLRDIAEERVCAALGLPAAIVGFGSGLQSTKVGAPQPLSARLWTPDGPTTMGAIEPGDRVAIPNGWGRVRAVYPQGEQDIYRITFQDGSTAESTADHLWQVRAPGEQEDRVVPLRTVSSWASWRLRRTTVPLQGVTEFAERPLTIPPYVMGLLLADGCLGPRNLQFTSVKPDVVERITEEVGAGYAVNQTSDGGIDYRIAYRDAAKGRGLGGGTGAANPFKDELRRLGLWGKKAHEKFIPDDYKYNSSRVRRQIMQGLLDGDGFVNLHGQPAIEQTSPRLADDITEIVQSLGGYALRSAKRANRALRWLNGHSFHSRHDRVHLSIVIEDGASLFATPAKRDRCRPRTKEATRKFRQIELVRREQAQCIEVDGSLYLTDGFIVTHNTMREMRRLAWVQCLTPMQKSMAKELTTQLLPDFQTQNRFRVRFDTADVSVFQEDDDLLSMRVARLVTAGVLRVDRAQAMLGLEVDSTQQIYLRPTAAIPEGPSAPKLPASVPDPVLGAPEDTDDSNDTKALAAIAVRRGFLPNGNGNGKQ